MKKLTVLFCCLCLGWISACTKKDTQNTSNETTSAKMYFGTTTPKHGPDEIWINNREEPQHLDPQLATGVPDGHLAMNTFARLVQIDPKTSKPIGDLAKSWEVSNEGRTYTFAMREGLKFSDEKPLTSEDVKYSWLRLMSPALGARYSSLAYTTIEGGEAYARRAIWLTGFSQSPKLDDMKSFLESKGIGIEKVTQRYQSNDVFVYVADNNDADRDKLVNFFKNVSKWGNIQASVADASVVELETPDPLTVVVTLTGPLPYFTLLAEFTSFAIVPRHAIERVAKANNGDERKWVRPENIVVSGPYKLVEENFKLNKIYEKNPHYWDAANVKTPKIKILMIETETAVMNAYKVGEIDVFGPHEVPSEQVKLVSKYADFYNDPYLGVYYYYVNHAVKPFDDPRVRKALSLAIDRKQITDYVLGGGYQPYHGFVPDGLAGYQSYQDELFNPERAKKLLAEAGFPEGQGFPKFTFKYDTKEIHRLVAQAVQEMWKKNLNIDFEMVNVEWKVYLDDMNSTNFEITRYGWIGDFLDPYTFLELLTSQSGNNHSNWKNATYDQLIETANRTEDEAKRLELFKQAETMVIDEQVVIPLFLYTKTYMLKPYVKGFYKDYQDHHLWKHMWIDPNFTP